MIAVLIWHRSICVTIVIKGDSSRALKLYINSVIYQMGATFRQPSIDQSLACDRANIQQMYLCIMKENKIS